MKGLIRGSMLLVVGLVLLGSGYGVWLVQQRSARSAGAPETSASRLIWPATHRAIRTLEQDVRRGDANEATYTQLGYTYVQGARETGDGAYNDKAEDAFTEALERDPRSFEAMNGMGMVYLTLHQFGKALEWGKRSLEVNPHRARTYGILVDAYVELGQYDRAVEAAQQMVDTRPDLASYSRVSYVRELMGDTEGAIDAMQRAVSAGSGSLEHTNWSRVYLGHLYFKSGDLAEAERQYQMALQQLPYYGHALAGLARVRAAQGQLGESVRLYEEAVEVFPIGEYIIALGDAYETAGQPEKASAQYERALEELEAEREGGMDVDEELALLLLDQGRELERALALAKGAYERRPTVKNADILAWAQYKTGHLEEAYQAAQEALRLGTDEARFYYHAGIIAAQLGKRGEAQDYLRQALDINPYFSLRDAEVARQTLAELED